MVTEIQPRQTFPRRTPAHPDTMDENNTPTALKGCGVKIKLSICIQIVRIYQTKITAFYRKKYQPIESNSAYGIYF